MKIKYLAFLLSVSCLLFACRKSFYEYDTVNWGLKIVYPDTYSKKDVEGAKVTLKNTITGASSEFISDAGGSVSWRNITPGVYTVTVSRTLSLDEAESLTGNRGEVFLNGSISPLTVKGGDSTVTLQLKGSTVGGFVIKEYYYAGVPSAYFYDLFMEIYNNSTDTLYADSICMGNTKVNSTAGSVYGFLDSSNYVYLQHIWMVPGAGKDVPIAPGKSFIIAMDGINHKDDPLGNPNSPVNLGAGIADFETYFPYTNRDADAADVPNLIHVYAGTTAGFDWLPGVLGHGLVVFKHPDPQHLPTFTEPGTSATARFIRVPVASILDGVDCVANTAVTPDKKRLPATVDAGMTTVGGTYNGKSVRRKIKTEIDGRKILVDTNNSTADFEINSKPTPKGW
ncbi:DUF4876 domain-containing protein [Filimonas effusa]|uniref:DUF4876 domain-containing protein n=1 Tax=Filimonas effusa TaxID=2508721 RepID=A0A4Q1D7G4_9BACT|nr:DUF4876 domain-containing protein [Filimonas effusa]RXK83691.1 DUF4876 domain-containing protein [Filimonas effusa]